ncbi:MAG: hypothetical protein A2Z75_05320 [Chloroflexi bacterium RBG_13_50_10]|nr:MAG: hypothetical protein A2Z75_05320 [Chloroflexi bacterium RBG_13_50_10]
MRKLWFRRDRIEEGGKSDHANNAFATHPSRPYTYLPTIDKVRLPSKRGEYIEMKPLPRDGFWVRRDNEEDKHTVYLWCLWLQLFQIPEARKEYLECLERASRGPARVFRELVRKVKPTGRASTMEEYNAKMKLIESQLMTFRRDFDSDKRASDKYINSVVKIFMPWVEKWAFGSVAMLNAIQIIAISGNILVEAFTDHRTRNRVSMRGIDRMRRNLWQRIKERSNKAKDESLQPADLVARVIALHCGQPFVKEWDILLRSGRDRGESADRKKARATLRGYGRQDLEHYRQIESRTVARDVWCFTQFKIRGFKLDQLDEMYIPYKELYKTGDSPRYMKPVIDALNSVPTRTGDAEFK